MNDSQQPLTDKPHPISVVMLIASSLVLLFLALKGAFIRQ
jgi:hypothetical protein